MTHPYTDGNAIAGPLSETFAVDISNSRGRCVYCGMQGPIASLHVYDHAPGIVARCPGCQEVMMRVVRGPDRAWIDLRGVVALEIPLAAPTPPA